MVQVHWKKRQRNMDLFKRLMNLGQSPLLASIVATRNFNISDEEEYGVFLEGKVENLEEPELIPDIQGFKNLFKNFP